MTGLANGSGTIGATAGGSAKAEHDRRLARHQERVRRERPFLLVIAAVGALVGAVSFATGATPFVSYGALVLCLAAIGRMITTPAHVTAWATGAEGEGRTAAALEPLGAEGFRILHDRRIPRSRANIDHIVIGPPGVFVVETKSFSGKLEIRGTDVYVARRRRTAMLDEVRREAAAVEAVLVDEQAALGIIVRPLICVHRAELPLFRSEVAGIPILSAKALVKRLRTADKILPPAEVEHLAAAIEARLRPAARHP